MYSKFAARTPSPLRSEITPGEEPQKPSTRRTHSKSSARSEQRKSRATSTRTSSLDGYQPHACEIVPGFLVSDTHTATSPEILDELGVTHMISLMRDGEPSYTPDINHVCIPIDVTAQSKLIQSFDCAVVWIATAIRDRGTVLVHCMWGTSRTVSVAVAYLMATEFMTLEDAVAVVRSRRAVLGPDSELMEHLAVYEKEVCEREQRVRHILRKVDRGTLYQDDDED